MKLSDQAYGAVRAMLIDGRLRPGQFISQRELSRLAGLSLGPTREAIQKLATDGLVEVIPQRGVRIADATPRMIRNAFDLRQMVEGTAVRHYCLEATDGATDALLQAHLAIRAAADTRMDSALLAEAQRIDQDMHRTFVDALRNALVDGLYAVNADRIRLVRADDGLLRPAILRRSMDEHIAVLRACKGRDPDAAATALATHIDAAMRAALGV